MELDCAVNLITNRGKAFKRMRLKCRDQTKKYAPRLNFLVTIYAEFKTSRKIFMNCIPELSIADHVARVRENLPLISPYLVDVSSLSIPALSGWNLDYFRDQAGEDIVQIENQYCSKTVLAGTYFEYLEKIRESPAQPKPELYYLRDWNILGKMPALKAECDLNDLVPTSLFEYIDEVKDNLTWLYIGPSGSATDWHVDKWHTATWMLQIAGEKEWHFQDSIGKKSTVVLEPGCILFVPSGMRHRVTNLTETIAVTTNFLTSNDYIRVREEMLELSNRHFRMLTSFPDRDSINYEDFAKIFKYEIDKREFELETLRLIFNSSHCYNN